MGSVRRGRRRRRRRRRRRTPLPRIPPTFYPNAAFFPTFQLSNLQTIPHLEPDQPRQRYPERASSTQLSCVCKRPVCAPNQEHRHAYLPTAQSSPKNTLSARRQSARTDGHKWNNGKVMYVSKQASELTNISKAISALHTGSWLLLRTSLPSAGSCCLVRASYEVKRKKS